jgi:hypothetical protein
MLGRLLGARHPIGIAAVGALFALSFDTVSQAALFAVSAAHFGGALLCSRSPGRSLPAWRASTASTAGDQRLVMGINSRLLRRRR